MTSLESIVHAVEKVFKNTMFLRKDMLAEHLTDRCPTIEKFEVKEDEDCKCSILTIFYDDVIITARIYWRKDKDSLYYVVDKTELMEVLNIEKK